MTQIRFKYPKTPHLPFSETVFDDDSKLFDVSNFVGQKVVITEKRDGENTTMYSDYFHARSIDGRDHPSRAYVKKIWGDVGYAIPQGWRVCGENLYARHSIEYENLKSYFEVFSIWSESNRCLSWNETLMWASLLDFQTVPVLYQGIFDLDNCKQLAKMMDREKQEGFVVRLADSFMYSDFHQSVAKYVRANHVQTDDHWMFSEIVPNKLINNKGQSPNASISTPRSV